MINHISIGASSIERAKAFYDAALKPLGYRCTSAGADSLGYGDDSATALWILAVKAPIVANPQSGLHLCFDGPTRKAVEAFHKAGVKAGGRDNGKPGLRTDYGPNYYAAFLVDPDGYRIEAYCGARD